MKNRINRIKLFSCILVLFVSCENGDEIRRKERLTHFQTEKINIEGEIKSSTLQLKFAKEKLERANTWHPGDNLFPARKEERIRNAEQELILLQNELDTKENKMRAINDSIRRLQLK